MRGGSCDGGLQVILCYFIAIYLNIDSVGKSVRDLSHTFANFKSQMLALRITFGGGKCQG
ncbi:hypothetical protein MicvaDRAFT_4602 [Microcoleus vaginatus FGP-2]|nr:hypothetical protein MicvaDRAFT_4602 [Microcoleus vaginatus FGP-2]